MSIADIQSQINAEGQQYQQSVRDERRALPADCYPLPKFDLSPQARLYVLKDGVGNAEQAALHFYSQLLTEAERATLKKVATNLVRRRYFAANAEVPITVYQNGQPTDLIRVLPSGEDVEPLEADEAEVAEPLIPLRLVVAGILATFVAAGLFFLLLNGLLRRSEPATTASATPPAAQAAPTGTPTVPVDPATQQVQTNNLPPSKNANPAIGIGMTVRIGESYVSTVRSEAGSDAGEVVGYLKEGGTAVVIGGPTWLQGNTDTIVWWYVELPNGQRGWTPANTSEFTLLAPAP